jgi:hypothetical protein
MRLFVFAEVETTYDGPRMESDQLTLEFVKEMMETFKKQKKLHRK